jgi:hypothetical protein
VGRFATWCDVAITYVSCIQLLDPRDSFYLFFFALLASFSSPFVSKDPVCMSIFMVLVPCDVL